MTAKENSLSDGRNGLQNRVPQTRTQEAYQSLASKATELGPNGQLPTFLELREQLGISAATLNKALELLEAQRIVYRRHGVGIFVSPDLGRKTVALVCGPQIFEGPEVSPVWQLLIHQIRHQVVEQGHEISMHFAAFEDVDGGLYEDFRRAVEAQRIQGVAGIGLSRRAVEWLTRHQVPIVGFAGSSPNYIAIDYERIVREGTQFLAARGCQRIALFTLITPQLPYTEPFRETLTQTGRPFDPNRIGNCRTFNLEPKDRPFSLTMWEQGFLIGQAFFAGKSAVERPDGVVTTSELLTQGLIMGIQQSGLRVGVDVEIVAHANEDSPILQPWATQISRFEVSLSGLARQMLEMLETMMNGETVTERVLQHNPILYPRRKDG